jgi:hypothetical protein
MTKKRYWTDYPILSLGDLYGKKAPVRECTLISYDGDKYCFVSVGGVTELIKAGYIYQERGRYDEVPPITRRQLKRLPAVDYEL